ncbi:DUF7114 family protein [Halopiger goleimassiliensis]|uniref:DUF7114 family protein n=1 Tax=Halopiger goleimassiliensis TaxID=1293048 RepID=UPI000677D8F8|nr:hypothetical protein [Halopiger goleimassiliensis]
MDPADSCRRAAVEAVADVEPPRLHDLVDSVLKGASMVPGALTLESAARAATDEFALEESTGEFPAGRGSVLTHAAGVQLIYEGLRLTRTIAHEEPWTDGDAGSADLEILAADILVARGFYLLARTDAADKAVRTVRNFGHDQTARDDIVRGRTDGDPAALDANLERDVLELAVRTGAASVDEPPSPRLLAIADDLARDVGPSFPPAEECLADLETPPLETTLEDGPTDRATSATDP